MFSCTFEVFVKMVGELTELSRQEIIKIRGSRYSFLMTLPSEPLSLEITKIICSRHGFPKGLIYSRRGFPKGLGRVY